MGKVTFSPQNIQKVIKPKMNIDTIKNIGAM